MSSPTASPNRRNRFLWAPPLATVAVFVAPSVWLPQRYLLLPTFVTGTLLICATVCGILFVAWERGRRYDDAVRAVGAFVVIMSTVTVASFVNLLAIIFTAGPNLKGTSLLASAALVWLGNVMSFALWYWYLDGVLDSGRRRELLFPELGLAGAETWQPNFMDYVFVSLTAALAFGPTDTPPASTRMRLVMVSEALISFVTVALVTARAINAIG